MTATPQDATTGAPTLFACDMQTPGTPGRCLQAVRNDPTYAGLFAEADEHFRQAEAERELQPAFDHFRQAVAILRRINAAELRVHGAAE